MLRSLIAKPECSSACIGKPERRLGYSLSDRTGRGVLRGRALCRSHIRRSGGLHGVPNDVTERRPARFLAAAQNGTSGVLACGKHVWGGAARGTPRTGESPSAPEAIEDQLQLDRAGPLFGAAILVDDGPEFLRSAAVQDNPVTSDG